MDEATELTGIRLVGRLSRADMIRSRDLEAYQALLGIDIKQMAIDSVNEKGKFVWYDMGCGDFQAGISLTYGLYQDARYGKKVADRVIARGIDLDTDIPGDYKTFGAIITRGNAVDFPIPSDLDLLTGLQALRWIEKFQHQGLEAIEHWYNSAPVHTRLAFDYPTDLLPQQPLQYLKSTLGSSISMEMRAHSPDILQILSITKPTDQRIALPRK